MLYCCNGMCLRHGDRGPPDVCAVKCMVIPAACQADFCWVDSNSVAVCRWKNLSRLRWHLRCGRRRSCLGEFTWSLQHSGLGGWDGGSASVRSCVAEQAAFAGTTSGRAAGAPAAFLGIDRGGAVERGRGDWRGRVGAGRSTVVSEVRRHATIDACAIIEAVVWAIPVVCRAGGACNPACPGRRGAADRPAHGAVGIDDLARAAAQRCHARRRVGLSGHYGAVAC